jgi:hypothetical protein
MGSPRFLRTVTKAVAVAGRVVERPAGKLPGPFATATSTISTASRVAYRAMRVPALAQRVSLVGTGAVAVGVVAATSTIGWIATGGALLAIAGALVLGLGLGVKEWRLAGRVVFVVLGGLLAIAGWMHGAVHDRVFGWLEKTALPGLDAHPARWALVVVFLLLPPLVTAWQLGAGLRHRLAGKLHRGHPAPKPPVVIPAQRDDAPAVSETAEPRGAGASDAPSSAR